MTTTAFNSNATVVDNSALKANNSPLDAPVAPPAKTTVPAPVKTAVAPATSSTPATTAQSSPVANRSVTLPNGAVVQINDKGDIVSGDPTNGGKGILPGSDASHAVNAYEANQTQQSNNKSAADLAGATGSGANGSASFISSSDSVQSKEDAVTTALTGLQADNPATIQAHNDYISELQKEQDALEQRRKDEVDQINKDFDSQKIATEKTQANETGVENTMLQRAGGYLGMGASQTGALISLSQEHTDAMNSLEAKRQSAIQAANTAITDKQFGLAQAKVKEAQDYANAQADAKQKYFEDLIQVHKQQDNVTFAQDQAQKSLTALSALTPDSLSKIDPASLKKIDDAYGVPGFAKNYITTQHAINSAKSQVDAIDAQQKMLTLLQDVPKGQKITFPDPSNPNGPGITYTGLGKTGDVSTFTETDDAGRVTLFTYDKGSNVVTRSSLGSGGKTKTSGTNDADASLAGPTNALLTLAAPLDPNTPGSPKFVTANQYVNAYQNYVKLNPGKGAMFDAQFPLDKWVMPQQGTLAQQLLREKPAAAAQ